MNPKFIFTGSEFNKIHKGKSFIKLLNSRENHGGFQFVEGENIDEKYLGKSCYNLGFLFFESGSLEHIHTAYQYVREATIPADATVFCKGSIMRSDKLVLSKRVMLNRYLNLNKYKLLKKNGLLLKLFYNQTEEMCNIAIKQNPMSLEYIKDQNLDLCMEALIKNVASLRFVDEEYLRV